MKRSTLNRPKRDASQLYMPRPQGYILRWPGNEVEVPEQEFNAITCRWHAQNSPASNETRASESFETAFAACQLTVTLSL